MGCACRSRRHRETAERAFDNKALLRQAFQPSPASQKRHVGTGRLEFGPDVPPNRARSQNEDFHSGGGRGRVIGVAVRLRLRHGVMSPRERGPPVARFSGSAGAGSNWSSNCCRTGRIPFNS